VLVCYGSNELPGIHRYNLVQEGKVARELTVPRLKRFGRLGSLIPNLQERETLENLNHRKLLVGKKVLDWSIYQAESFMIG
jgi:hypothetical protein